MKKGASNKLKILFVLIWFASIAALYYGARMVCDRYCFDKLIYRKNNYLAEMYGYRKLNGNLCKAQLNSEGFRDDEFYPKEEEEYLVLIVGDSTVYGQGLLKHRRFSELLEKKLEKIQPTRVLNLGICGTNIYQHYNRITKYKEILNPDLIIISFSENDLLVWNSLFNFPQELSSDGVVLDIRTDEDESKYIEKVLASYDEASPNIEMAKYVASLLPKKEVLIISLGYLDIDGEYNIKLEETLSIFRDHDLRVIDAKDLYRNKYKELSIEREGKAFMAISEKEKHPNSLANKMFAERLFEEITTNTDFNYIK